MERAAVAAGRIIAIGDIHGCGTALRSLLSLLKPTASDTLVVLGDVIDRGPDSCSVLQQLLRLGDQCHFVPILGNHEQMLLDAVYGILPLQDWLFHGGAATLDSYGTNAALAQVPRQHIDFIATWGNYFETDGYFFAHANYQPKKELAQQTWEEMRWRSLKFFLPAPHTSGKTAVLGHTASKRGKIVSHGHIVCIDTFCHGGGWLTAFEPLTGKVWQANERGQSQQTDLESAQ